MRRKKMPHSTKALANTYTMHLQNANFGGFFRDGHLVKSVGY